MTDGAGYRTIRIPASAKPDVAELMPFVAELQGHSSSTEMPHARITNVTAQPAA
jgi:hypothetical protein